jgi:hypothetical protein
MLAVAGVVLVASAGMIWGAGGFGELPTSFARGGLAVVAGMFAALCYLAAGWLLASRLPRNPIGWLLLTMGLVFAHMTPMALVVDDALRAFRPAPPATVAAAWLLSSFSGPILICAGVGAGLLFPDGRVAGPRWRWALAALITGASLVAIATALRPAGLMWYPTLANPLAVPTAARPIMSLVATAGTVMLVAATGAMVLSLARRYRRGDGAVRAQLRWIMYAGTALAATLVPFMIARFVLPVGDTLGGLMVAAANATAALLPIAAAVAITRYNLFGIDLIISRTLVYVPMMAILSGLYTASIAIFQRIFVAVTGETSDAPLVITIFLVATAFTPVRKGLEGLVDRWIRGPSAAAGQPSGDPAQGMTPEVAEVAAAIVALRRFEARVAAGADGSGSRAAQRSLAIDAEGRVACPSGGTPHFRACLSCQYLAGISTAPATVMCTRLASSGSDATSPPAATAPGSVDGREWSHARRRAPMSGECPTAARCRRRTSAKDPT